MVYELPSDKLTTAGIKRRRDPFNTNRSFILLVCSAAKLKSNGNKASPCFRPF